MNDLSQMMNKPPQMMTQPPSHHMMNQPPPPQVMNSVPSHIMNQSQLMGQSQPMNHPIMGQMSQSMPMNLGQSQAMLNKPLMFDARGYNPNMKKYQNSSSSSSKLNNNFTAMSKQAKSNRNNWKGKKGTNDKRPIKDSMRRIENPMPISAGAPGFGGTGGYKPPTLNELQSQNRLKAKKFFHSKKKFNNRFAPYAPRNTSSYIIRAKKAGGIASLVSPCPVTPAVLPTPMFSPSREVLGDMAKEEWGVDGYGSMKGLIRLRSPGHEMELHDDDDEDEGGSSESDVEEHVEVERRLDHDLSRFEMIHPNYVGVEYNCGLENRVDDQDTHIAQLEEENLTLKERLFLMERELGDLRRRMQFLERQNQLIEDVNEEVVENGSENDSEEGESNTRPRQEDILADIAGNEGGQKADADIKEGNHEDVTQDVWMDEVAPDQGTRKEVDNKSKECMVDLTISKNEKTEDIEMRELTAKEMDNEAEKIQREKTLDLSFGGRGSFDEDKNNDGKHEEASKSDLEGDRMCSDKHNNETNPVKQSL